MPNVIKVELLITSEEAQVLADLADHLACTPLEGVLGDDDRGAAANLIASHIKRQLLKLGVEPSRFSDEVSQGPSF